MNLLFRAIGLLMASMLVGSFATLEMISVMASQLPSSTGERIAILESRQTDNRDIIAQIRTDISALKVSIEQERQHTEDIQNKISVITGIGIGLSSIMMILQLVQTVAGLHNRRRDEAVV